MKELNSIKIIAIDHGYGNIKTANTVTPTGITAYDTEPIFTGNILEYNGRCSPCRRTSPHMGAQAEGGFQGISYEKPMYGFSF